MRRPAGSRRPSPSACRRCWRIPRRRRRRRRRRRTRRRRTQAPVQRATRRGRTGAGRLHPSSDPSSSLLLQSACKTPTPLRRECYANSLPREMTLRIGLLSTASINRLLLGGARAAEGVDVVAVASRDLARARTHAAEHGIGRAHGSYDALLTDEDVDAVYVSLPNSLHAAWSIRALEAGKHVLCEKPLTRRPEDAEAAFDAAARAERMLAEAFMWRHHPQARRLRELVAQRAVGELRLLAGEPERVGARQVVGPEGVDVRFAGTMSFPGGVLGAFDCGLDMVAHHALEVVGDRGSILLSDPWHGRKPSIVLRRPGGDEAVAVPSANPYACELEDFAAAVRGERPHPFGRADAVGQARAIAALYRAAESGSDEAPRPRPPAAAGSLHEQ